MKKQNPIPFVFIIEALDSLDPLIKPMFGCHAIYIKEKIILILRKKGNEDKDNGIWIATTPEHHSGLKKDFPSLRSIKLFGEKVTGWQVIPEETIDFEECAFKLCEMILKGDQRIGKIPKQKNKKSKKES